MADEFAWRKKELHHLKSLISARAKEPDRDTYIRASFALLYAHWEGFVKRIGSCYLEFVARQSLTNNELPTHFLALSAGTVIRNAAATNKIQFSMGVVEFFRSQSNEKCAINWQSAINTKANLKSAVFREIVEMLGLDYSRFETKEKMIDEKLLRNRNTIAHGEYLLVTADEYLRLHDDMLAIMQDFFNQVENSAVQGKYRK